MILETIESVRGEASSLSNSGLPGFLAVQLGCWIFAYAVSYGAFYAMAKTASLSWRLARATGRVIAWPFRAAPVDPLLAGVVAALQDARAHLVTDDKSNGILAAGGVTFALRVGTSWVTVERAESGERDVWPDLTAEERRRAEAAVLAAVARVRERDRLASREASLAAILWPKGDGWKAEEVAQTTRGGQPVYFASPAPSPHDAAKCVPPPLRGGLNNRATSPGVYHGMTWNGEGWVPVGEADDAAKRDDKKKDGRG